MIVWYHVLWACAIMEYSCYQSPHLMTCFSYRENDFLFYKKGLCVTKTYVRRNLSSAISLFTSTSHHSRNLFSEQVSVQKLPPIDPLEIHLKTKYGNVRAEYSWVIWAYYWEAKNFMEFAQVARSASQKNDLRRQLHNRAPIANIMSKSNSWCKTSIYTSIGK